MIKIKIGYLMVDHKIKSVSELARKTNINRLTLAKLVNEEKIESLTFEVAFKLCNFFCCNLSDLIEYIPEEQPTEEQS